MAWAIGIALSKLGIHKFLVQLIALCHSEIQCDLHTFMDLHQVPGFNHLYFFHLLPPNQRRTEDATFPIKHCCTDSCRHQVCQKMLIIIVLEAQTPSITTLPNTRPEHPCCANCVIISITCGGDGKPLRSSDHNCSIRLPSGFTII